MPPRAAEFAVPNDASGVSAARRFTQSCLTDWGMDGVAEVAALLVSEAVTNALLHTGLSPSMLLTADAGALRVEVRDASPALPTIKDHGATATTGRGLHLIDALASQWGARPDGTGKVVWFEVALAPDNSAAADDRAASGSRRDGPPRPGTRVSGRVSRADPAAGRLRGPTLLRGPRP